MVLDDINMTTSRLGSQVDDIQKTLEGTEAYKFFFLELRLVYWYSHCGRVQEIRDPEVDIQYPIHKPPQTYKRGTPKRYRRVALRKGGVSRLEMVKRFKAVAFARDPYVLACLPCSSLG